MSEWIVDRLPDEDDCDSGGCVWIQDDDGNRLLCLSEMVGEGQAWYPIVQPPPYQPPAPDTSLADDLIRVDKWVTDVLKETPLGETFYRIIEAARKWDAIANQGKVVQGFDKSDTEPSIECDGTESEVKQ